MHEIEPIFLNNLITEIVDQRFDKIEHFLCQQVSLLECKCDSIDYFSRLQYHPGVIKLPFQKFTPEQVAE